jgi:hypothetical protein
VGGRRYRPALEDVIEFLIVENLARPRAGWKRYSTRAGMISAAASCAAIRRDIQTARQAEQDFDR